MYEYKDKDGTYFITGHRLKAYYTEHVELYPDLYQINLNKQDATKICKKLARHFKLYIIIQFEPKRKNGRHVSWKWSTRSLIKLPQENIPLGLITHELAHARDHKTRKKLRHDKKFMHHLKVINNYVRKKEYWGLKKEKENSEKST